MVESKDEARRRERADEVAPALPASAGSRSPERWGKTTSRPRADEPGIEGPSDDLSVQDGRLSQSTRGQRSHAWEVGPCAGIMAPPRVAPSGSSPAPRTRQPRAEPQHVRHMALADRTGPHGSRNAPHCPTRPPTTGDVQPPRPSAKDASGSSAPSREPGPRCQPDRCGPGQPVLADRKPAVTASRRNGLSSLSQPASCVLMQNRPAHHPDGHGQRLISSGRSHQWRCTLVRPGGRLAARTQCLILS